MPTRKDVAKLFERRLNRAQFAGERRARIGKLDSSGALDLKTGLAEGYVWVRIEDDARQTVPALCLHVKRQLNLRVIVFYNRDGILTVKDIDTHTALETYGEAAATMTVPDRIGELVKEVVPTRNLAEARLRVSGDGDLNVFIEPGLYRYGGTRNYWGGGLLNLTSYRPATASHHAWVVSCLDGSDNTATAVAGTSQSVLAPLTLTQMAAVGIGVLTPVGAVKLRNGQTEILDTDIVDAREILSGDLGALVDVRKLIEARIP